MSTAITIVNFLFRLYSFLILIRVILSWVNVNPYRPAIDHPVIRVIQQITDPVLEPLRRIIPPVGGTLDISPVVALIILEIVRVVLLSLLARL